MLSGICVLLGLVALAAAQSSGDTGGDPELDAFSSLEDKYTGDSAEAFRRRHFYCLDVDSTIANFTEKTDSANRDNMNDGDENFWAIFLQYPILSYLDSSRKENLFNIIARLVQIGADLEGDTQIAADGCSVLSTFNESDICVTYVYHYGVSTFEESILININFRNDVIGGDDSMSDNDACTIDEFNAYFNRGFDNQAENMEDNNLVQSYLGRNALAIESVTPPGGLTLTELNSHPGMAGLKVGEENKDPTLRAVVLSTYAKRTTIDGMRESGEQINFAQNPNPFNLGLDAGDIVFAFFGSVFLVIVGFLTVFGFCIHPFFLA